MTTYNRLSPSDSTGKHLITLPGDPSSESMKQLLSTLLKDVSSALTKPVCKALIEFDCRSSLV